MFGGKSGFLHLAIAMTLPFPWGATATYAAESAVPEAIAVKAGRSHPPDGVADLKFKDFFKLPVGPRGLEPTPKLLSLDGKRVRIVGYLVRQEAPTAGLAYLAPLPIELTDEDESLSDDLPPSTLFIPLPTGGKPATYFPGLVRLTGRLAVGAEEEPDGRVSAVRLWPDPEVAQALVGGGPDNQPVVGQPQSPGKTGSQSHLSQ